MLFGEKNRLAKLEASGLLSAGNDQWLNKQCEHLAKETNSNVCLLSVVTRDEQIFKAKYGMQAHLTPRDQSFCTMAIQQIDPLVIPDATKDKRTALNPLVQKDAPEPVRAYAGRKISWSTGGPIGTVCIIHHNPKEFTKKDLESLEIYAAKIETYIQEKYEIPITVDEPLEIDTLVLTIADDLPYALAVLDEDGYIVMSNKKWHALIDSLPPQVKSLYNIEAFEEFISQISDKVEDQNGEELFFEHEHRKFHLYMKDIPSQRAIKKTATLTEITNITNKVEKEIRDQVQATKGKLINLISHEFNTPLSTLQLTIQTLAADNLEVSQPRLQRQIARIGKLVKECQDAINYDENLTLTKVPTRPIELVELLEKVTVELEVPAQINNDFRNKVQLLIDLNQMKTALTYLFEQIKVLNNRAEVLINCYEKRGVMIQLTINTPQLSKEFKSGLETMFAESSFAHLFENYSLGLALYITRQIIVAHDASIMMQNRKNDSIVTIKIPQVIKNKAAPMIEPVEESIPLGVETNL